MLARLAPSGVQLDRTPSGIVHKDGCAAGVAAAALELTSSATCMCRHVLSACVSPLLGRWAGASPDNAA